MATHTKKEIPNGRWECQLPDCGNAGARAGKAQRAGEADDAQWKEKFYNKVQQRGLNLQHTTMAFLQKVKAEEEKVHKTDPSDPLAREWFSTDKETVDVRAYMLDKLLPTLMPGVEKLLMEAEKRGHIDPKETNVPKFNPINFLAETLMRNNPQIIAYPKTSSYTRGLKETLKDLKSQVADVEFDRVAHLKQEMKEAQEQWVQQKAIDSLEKDKRKEALALQFLEWTLDSTGRIPMELIQSALQTFQELASQSLLQPNLVSHAKDLETDEMLEHKLNVEEFVEYIYPYAKDLSADVFEELLHHLSQSADIFRDTIRHDRWRQMFIDLFLACDHEKVGFLDRPRVLQLLEAFFNSAGPEDAVWGFRNPRQWPMIEMDPLDFQADFGKAPKVSEQEESAIVHPSASAHRVSPYYTSSGLLPDFDETTKVSEHKESLLPHPSSSDRRIYPTNTDSGIWTVYKAPKAPKLEGSLTVRPTDLDLQAHPSKTSLELRKQNGYRGGRGVDSMMASQTGGELEATAKSQRTERIQSALSHEAVPEVSAGRQGLVSLVAQPSRQQLEVAAKRQSNEIVRSVHSLETVSKVSAVGQSAVPMVAQQSIQEEAAAKRRNAEKVEGAETSEVVPSVSAERQGIVSKVAQPSRQEPDVAAKKVVKNVHSLETMSKVSAVGQSAVPMVASQSIQEEAAVRRRNAEKVEGAETSEAVPSGSAETKGLVSMVAQPSRQQLEVAAKRQNNEVVGNVQISALGQSAVSMVARQNIQEEAAVKRRSAEKVEHAETSEVMEAALKRRSAEKVEHAETSEVMEAALKKRSAEKVEHAETPEIIEAALKRQSAEKVEHAETSEVMEAALKRRSAEKVEHAETSEVTEAAVKRRSAEKVEHAEASEVTEAALKRRIAEKGEHAETSEVMEAALKRRSAEKVEHAETSEFMQAALKRLSAEKVEHAETSEVTEAAVKRRSAEKVEHAEASEVTEAALKRRIAEKGEHAETSEVMEAALKRRSAEKVEHDAETSEVMEAALKRRIAEKVEHAETSEVMEAALKRRIAEKVVHAETSAVIPAERQGPVSMGAQLSRQQLEMAEKRQHSEVARNVHYLEKVSKGYIAGQGKVSMMVPQSIQEKIALRRQRAEKVGRAETSEVVPTVPPECLPPNTLAQENTNVNAGNDELVADSTGESTSGTPPSGSQNIGTHEQNIVSERKFSSPRQRHSMLMGTQLGLEVPTAVQSPIDMTTENDAKVRESQAEAAAIGHDLDAITMPEGNQLEGSSLVLTPEESDAEEQRTGDVDEAQEPQSVDGIPWSGDLLTPDLFLKYGSYGNRSLDEWIVATSQFADLRPIITDIHSWEPPRVTSAFDRNSLNLPQFVQLLESFLGEESSQELVERLVEFIRNGYVETEEEKSQSLEKAQREAFSARRKLVLDALFKKWDNEGSGFVDMSQLEAALAKYKSGIDADMLNRGRVRLKSAYPCKGDSVRINARDFQRFMEFILAELPGTEEEVFEKLVEFLTASVARTQIENMRGAARRKWQHEIQRAAESCGGNMEPVFQATFQALFKDAESHGNKKKISASIGILEQSPPDAGRSSILLRYVACTPEDAPYVLDKALYRDMLGVSFDAIDGGKPVHVPRVQYHGNIQFWKYDRPVEERTGSFLVMPLKDSNLHMFGTLGIDTIRDAQERNIFLLHEISFYQGVANTFSEAYHYVLVRRNILLLVSSALAWIHNRAPNIQSVTTYLMEPGTEKEPDYVLRKAMTTDNNTGLSETHPKPATLRRKENLFRDYLFKCADISEIITRVAYGESHIAVPIREPSGRAVAVVDICTGQCRELPGHEFQDLQKMLQMLQAACNEILQETDGDKEKTFVLEAERSGDESRLGVLFYRFMLQDLRECVRKLDHRSFAELKSYKEPPVMIHNILRAVLLLFNPEWAATEEVESWSQCKLKVNSNLVQSIYTFDPTASTVRVHPEVIAKYIKGIPRGAVWRHGSVPAEYLYNWAFTCLSLLELNPQLPENPKPSLASLVPSQRPSQVPSQRPSQVSSQVPSQKTSLVPSQMPSLVPSQEPSQMPSKVPSQAPSSMSSTGTPAVA